MRSFRRSFLLLALPFAFLAGCVGEGIDPAGPYSFKWDGVQTSGNTATVKATYTVAVSPDPTVEAGVVYTKKGGSGVGEAIASQLSRYGFTTVVSGLDPDSEYILCVYAKIADGTKYLSTSTRTIKTSSSGDPVPVELEAEVGTLDAVEISLTGARLTARYTVSGNEGPVSAAGFKYRKDGDTSWNEIASGSTVSPLSAVLTGLAPGTEYHAAAWITVDGETFETSLSDPYSFTTLVPGEVSVEVRMAGVTGISETGAAFSANYTVAGSALPVSSAGFKYRRDGVLSWTSVTAASAASPFSYKVSGLTSDTKYYVTAWVIHDGKTYESPAATPAEFTTESGGTVVTAGGWAELPVMKEMDNVVYATYYVNSTGQADADRNEKGRVRNYTVCYDGNRHQPLWCAYPMHPWYNGGADRNESWKYGPYISTSVQPNLSSSYAGVYSRGHNVASSDRQRSVAMNKQTFYYSNMSPQIQNEFNGGIWNDLEKKVQGWGFNCSDTLYVVTGAAFINPTRTASDKSGMTMPVATHFYKVLLSSKTGRTGKPISQLSASELKCVGFWLDHFGYGTKSKISTGEMESVAEIERLTGFTFFPMLSESAKSVKETYSTSDWNL